MGIRSQDIFDDSSAYLVGIKDTIACYTYHFSKETMWINAELYNKHIMDELEDLKKNDTAFCSNIPAYVI